MKKIIREILNEFSVKIFGFCDFSTIEPYLIDCRAKFRIPDKAKTIITMLFPYYVNVGQHNISRYAVITDYHEVCGKILDNISKKLKLYFKDFNFVPFIDNSPIPEVRCGVLSGLGYLGDNGLLINKKYGSWVFIGEIITDMKIESYLFHNECQHCGKCERSCPSGAISKNGVDKSLCISKINQKKGNLTDKEINLLRHSGCIWGCDICQEVCPLNKNIHSTNIAEFYDEIICNIDKSNYNILENRAFNWRPDSVLKRNLDIIG